MVSSVFIPWSVFGHLTFSSWRTGGHGYPSQPEKNQASRRASFVDGSGPLFSMYVDMTAEQDRTMAKSWKGDADGILVFVSPDITPSSLYVNHKHPRLVCSPLPLQR